MMSLPGPPEFDAVTLGPGGLIETIQPGEIGAVDGNLAYDERPGWFETWEQTGLVVFAGRKGPN